jgi:hypothetical protein
MRPRPADDAPDTEWAEYYFEHRNDPEEWGEPIHRERESVARPGDLMTLKYRRPGKNKMESTTVRVPSNWDDMTTEKRKEWAQAECNRVCPGATEVSLR